jgi:hypothetical protein
MVNEHIKIARGRNTEVMGDFKRVGREIYKKQYSCWTGQLVGYSFECVLEDGDTLINYFSFRQMGLGE